MFCPACGAQNEENAPFCSQCGTPLSGSNEAVQQQMPQQPVAQQPMSQQPAVQQQMPQQLVAQQQMPQQPQFQQQVQYAPIQQKSVNGLGIAGFVCALCAALLSWAPIVNWILWLVGLILSGVGVTKQPKGLAIAGLVISLIGLVLIIAIVACTASVIGVLLH